MKPFNKNDYVIEERKRTDKKIKYVLYHNGIPENNTSSLYPDVLENELNIRESKSKIKHLPTFYKEKEFLYCFTKEDFLNYATYISFKCILHEFLSNKLYPDKYFIKNADNIWHGPDWYYLNSIEDEDDVFHQWDSFQNIRTKLEKEINGFVTALQNPKSWEEIFYPDREE